MPLCLRAIAPVTLSLILCGCGKADRSQKDDYYKDLYRDLLEEHFDRGRVTGEKKHIPDKHAEKYVELMIRDLETDMASDDDWKTFGAWGDAIAFLALNTSMPWDAFPKSGSPVVVEGRTINRDLLCPDHDTMKKYRRQIIAAAKAWLEARRGRLVFSTFGEGVEIMIGFCSIEEQSHPSWILKKDTKPDASK